MRLEGQKKKKPQEVPLMLGNTYTVRVTDTQNRLPREVSHLPWGYSKATWAVLDNQLSGSA